MQVCFFFVFFIFWSFLWVELGLFGCRTAVGSGVWAWGGRRAEKNKISCRGFDFENKTPTAPAQRLARDASRAPPVRPTHRTLLGRRSLPRTSVSRDVHLERRHLSAFPPSSPSSRGKKENKSEEQKNTPCASENRNAARTISILSAPIEHTP